MNKSKTCLDFNTNTGVHVVMGAAQKIDRNVLPALEKEVQDVYRNHLFVTFGESVHVDLGDFKIVPIDNMLVVQYTEETNVTALDKAMELFSKQTNLAYILRKVESMGASPKLVINNS